MTVHRLFKRARIIMIRLRFLSFFRFIYNFKYLLRDGGLSTFWLDLPVLCDLFDLSLPLRL